MKTTFRLLSSCWADIEPVSAQVEPSLRRLHTEMKNCEVETRARNPRDGAERAEICVSETGRRRANGPEGRAFFNPPGMAAGDRTGWLAI
jgi:hypothetical protein